MNKKSKIIIAVSVIVVFATAVGVLFWGLQPVQKESVTLEKLNKKVGAKYGMPSELPFEGDVECYIVYVEANMGVVLTRFEVSSKRSTGYSINLKDGKRRIYIETGAMVAINDEAAENSVTEYYNDQKIEYLFSVSETARYLTILFDINGKTYYIGAEYNNDIDSETLKTDIEFILNQMIK